MPVVGLCAYLGLSRCESYGQNCWCVGMLWLVLTMDRRFFKEDVISSNRLCVFVGIYNGAQYLDALFESLVSQVDQNFELVVVDNASSDESWSKLQFWKRTFNGRIKLSRNQSNVGGIQSIASNLELVDCDWVIFMHQDDLYLNNHIEELRRGIMDSEADTVAVSTSIGSVDNLGKRRLAPPRANWLSDKNDKLDNFIQNLRLQSLPFQATAFKSEFFRTLFPPSDLTSSGDVEVTLRLCALGRFRFVDRETMYYRENPMSESHSINELERRIGMAAGLCRVFCSEEFKLLLVQIDVSERSKFVSAVNDSIDVRLNPSPISTFIRLIANEVMATQFGQKEPASIANAMELYGALSATQAFIISERKLELLVSGSQDSNVGGQRFISETDSQNFSFLAAVSHPNDGDIGRREMIAEKFFTNRLAAVLPYRIRKSILFPMLKIYVRLNKRSPWNHEWR